MSRRFMMHCGAVVCGIGAGLSAAGASAAPSPFTPFTPLTRQAAAPRHDAGVLRSHVEVHGGGNDVALVPGTEQNVTIHGVCRSSDPEHGSCVGETTYSFDLRRIVVLDVRSEGAACVVSRPLRGQIICTLDLRPNQRHTLDATLKIDPDARDETAVSISAVGNYTVNPDELTMTLDPKATLRVTQSPNPTLVQNGVRTPLLKSRVLLRNDGPSAVHDVELIEQFSAQPTLEIALDPAHRDVCRGGDYGFIICTFGRLAPKEVRSYRFSASLPSQVPTSASTAIIKLSAELGAGEPKRFDLLHIGREYYGLLDVPDEILRDRPFTAKVEFSNGTPSTASNDVVPLQWSFDGGYDLELVDYSVDSKLMSCQRGAGAANQLNCQIADLTSIASSGDATLTLRARRSGLIPTRLSWSTALWGHDTSVYTLQVDEPPSR